MSDTPESPPPATPAAPAPAGGRKLKSLLKVYWKRVLCLGLLSCLMDYMKGDDSRAAVREFNDRFVRSVEVLNPMQLAREWYGGDKAGAGRDSISVPVTMKTRDGTEMKGGIPIPFSSVFKRVWMEGGVMSLVMAAIALLTGVLLMMLGGARSLGAFLWLAPLIGSVFIWVLVQIMWVAGLALGGVLDAVQFSATMSMGVPLLGMLIKGIISERENALTDKLLKRLE